MSTQSQYMTHTNDGDQRKTSRNQSDQSKTNRYEEGKVGSHQSDDPKDQRSIANRLEAKIRESSKPQETDEKDPNVLRKTQNPTDLAKEHGNEPSKGARIDEQIKFEEMAEVCMVFPQR
ncbi:hypothetical protein BY996DRAFT_6431464 [Phakopsora pachyrhizi]|uniref:Uncharacterized protein n=1 Tax=Phakopsora pachyrhizi TaxID=170000 RepID=A0AAV0AGA9_PHAPC|nr:hypothetical protein BY996DRAFT_6431464 [Phakopsora pachyrhizi]CAH7666499.1 hypothetical protein PPACK8108_LOCUS851 [Phakopsora pachyrhizi]